MLSNNVFSLLLNVIRVMSGNLSSSGRLPHTRSDGKTLIAVIWPWLAPPWAGWLNPKGRGNFGGCPSHSKALAIFTSAFAVTFAAKGIIQSPITSYGIQYARQAQIGIQKILSAGNAAYLPGRGWWECTAWAKSDICALFHICKVFKMSWVSYPRSSPLVTRLSVITAEKKAL